MATRWELGLCALATVVLAGAGAWNATRTNTSAPAGLTPAPEAALTTVTPSRTPAAGDPLRLASEQVRRAEQSGDVNAERQAAATLALLFRQSPPAGAWLQRAALASRRGDADAARADYTRALELDPSLSQARLGLAQLALRTMDLAAAEQQCGPLQGTALLVCNAACAIRQGRAEQARRALTRALDEAPTQAERAQLSWAAAEAADALDDPAAEALYRRALAQHETLDARLHLVDWLLDHQRPQPARSLLAGATADTPRLPAWRALAERDAAAARAALVELGSLRERGELRYLREELQLRLAFEHTDPLPLALRNFARSRELPDLRLLLSACARSQAPCPAAVADPRTAQHPRLRALAATLPTSP